MKTERKKTLRLMSVILALCLMLSVIAPITVFAEDVPLDGVNDNWSQDAATATNSGEVCEVTADGWLHLKSGTANTNEAIAPGGPAVFVNNDYTVGETGYFEATLKPISAAADTRVGFYLGYDNPAKAMFIGYDAGGWFWQKYDGTDNLYSAISVAAPAAGTETDVRIDWANGAVTLTVDGTVALEDEEYSSIPDLGTKIGFKCATLGGNMSEVMLKDIHYNGQATTQAWAVSGKVTDTSGAAVAGVGVEINGKTTTTANDGTYTISGLTDGSYTATFSRVGYEGTTASVTVAGTDVTGIDATITAVSTDSVTLSTDMMDVLVDTNFPRAIKYTMKGDLAGKVMNGQESALTTMQINGVTVTPEVVSEKINDSEIKYTMTIKGTNIDCVLTASITVADNTLSFDITDVQNNLNNDTYPVQTIYIPNHSLISVNSSETDANLYGAIVSSRTKDSGDEYTEVNASTAIRTLQYVYAVISNDQLSASIESNSEVDGRSKASIAAGSNNTRITSVSENKGSYISMGLGSSLWYFNKKVTTSGTSPKTYVLEETEMPSVKVVITGDENGDETINWNDGAIAFRSISHEIYGSEYVPELVAYRIAMNFGGQAQNPFLTSLDNVKKVALNTDGLGQSILLKGYGNEGHDSGHPDYGDIGMRIGGAEDMNTLMVEGAKYGARFGIHINASEMYPEAKAFSENLVKRNNSTNALSYGWNWIDQGIGIDALYDLASGERNARFDELKAQVGDNLDFIYLDVWGNCTSGNEDSLETRKISKQINDHGWRMGNEWGVANDYSATFQHWAVDLGYGGADAKGFNSALIRFIRNAQKDSWVADVYKYGGAANAPLLGGVAEVDFEGWQGGNDYDRFITNLYRYNLSTKFLQHYDAIKWVDGEPTNYTLDGSTYTWTPEMEITLADADGDTVVVTRGSNDYNSADYRNRTITLNGKTVLTGAVVDFYGTVGGGNETYLLPWVWDSVTGDKVADSEEKMYHWNTLGGTTTWDLQDDWAALENVKVYTLTDLGKTDEQIVPVVDGQITLTAAANTPYVVTKGEETPIEVEWSTGMHVVDAGFNAGNLDAWSTDAISTGTASLSKSQYSNPMLTLNGDVGVLQRLTDLIPGQKYAAYVGVDNRSDGEAFILVTSDSETIFMIGDVDSDEKVTANDAILVLQYYGKLITADTEGFDVTVADVNFDGDVNAKDAIYILQFYSHIIERFPNEAEVVSYAASDSSFTVFNSSLTSIAKNYVKAYSHSNSSATVGGTSYFQNMYVFFTAPEDGSDVYIELGLAESSKGNAYFDDVRIVENESENIVAVDEHGFVTEFTQDFETSAQGLYPFVVGGIEGVEDNRTHLSELHAPYTQAGWDVKKMDDVIDGSWSIKVNGLTQRRNLVMQTIPQNFYFVPGVTYSVSFDYEVGTTGTYAVIIGDGEFNRSKLYDVMPLEKTLDGTSHHETYTFSVTGSESGQTWFGIYSTGVAPDTTGASNDNEGNFGGYKDLVIDNLNIKVSNVQKGDLISAVNTGNKLIETDYEAAQWPAFAEAHEAATVVKNDIDAEQDAIDEATSALNTAMNALVPIYCTISGTITDTDGAAIAGATVTLTATGVTALTATTDANGNYSFSDIFVRAYAAKVAAEGYQTKYNVTPDTAYAAGENTLNATLTLKGTYSYTNYFDDSADVEDFVNLEGNTSSTGVTVSYDETGAAVLQFPGGGRNNIVLEDAGEFVNAEIEFDLTPASDSIRFGVVFRATNMNNRVFVGVGDTNGDYFYEWWSAAGGNSWSAMYPGTEMMAGEEETNTYHIKASLQGSTIKMSVDGVEVVNQTISGSIPTTSGYIGFECRSGSQFTIDNIEITSLD